MFRNYLKIAWRNIARSKTFSFINVLGLALGMTSSLLILLWVQDERSIDQFHANGPNIYEVLENQQWTGNDISTTPSTPGPLAFALKAEVPEVERTVKVTWQEEHLLSVGDKGYKEKGRYSSPDLFQIFSFPLAYGDPKTAIAEPTSIVISEKAAQKLFGRTDVLGRMVRVDNKEDHKVTGVVKDIPETSSLKFDFVLPEAPYEKENKWLEGWDNNGIRTYALLHPNADIDALNDKILNFIKKHDKNVTTITTFLFPYEKAYLQSKFTNGKPDGGRIEYVRIFTIVAIFLLIIACINFMNLATARSAKRAKEVGIRKVVGAERSYLVGQFVGEAVLTALFSLLIAIVLVQVLLSSFNTLTEKHIEIQYANPLYWLTLFGLALITGLISGSYPALFLSSLQPVKVLKGTLRFTAGAVFFRQGLVVFQFALSLLLIIGTLIAGRQVDYIRTKNLGLDRENVVYMDLEGDLPKRFDAFREELLQAPGIQSVSSAGNDPMQIGSSTTGVEWKGKPEGDKTLFNQLPISYDFISTMKIKLLDGRDFSKGTITDSTNYIVNEEAARRMGASTPGMKSAVGQDLKFWGKSGKIVGLIKNFHINSLRVAIEPLILRLDSTNTVLLVRTQPGQTEKALKSMERLAKQFNPAYPFDYTFADESFREQYKSETLIGTLANAFAIIAIFIACLGLFGLAMFTAEQRTKEIGVRKVLGASVPNIVVLLSKDFLKLVLIAILIASPLAWWAMHQWLKDFAYRIDIEWWVFALAGLIAIGIAQLTVSFQSIKAALMNPVKSLRSAE
ncbi:ABC transporter permease [Spirosoma fluviale]|uniref:Duplicated orphan permease n=1 Tax=Spirosoma fluviale TaxID=1597977 RepID=A0A286F734_9BACT|nr:ABC transporter permease [Spirosoma fluviale]SOD79037.1 duplicated orphan permease [Spirosoma fluviale]